MEVEVQERSWSRASRRRVPRFRVQAPMDVTVLRSGMPDTVPGRSLNLCERGIGAVLAGEVAPGEAVGVEVRLPMAAEFLRMRAVVKYQEKLRCGLEFIGLSAEQRAAIRGWAKESRAEAEASVRPVGMIEAKTGGTGPSGKSASSSLPGKPKKPFRAAEWSIFALVGVILLAAVWWRWNRGWRELEAGIGRPGSSAALKPQAQVPPEVMQKLLIHRVEPSYPAEARRAHLEGVIALDIVVGPDGSVISVRPLNGPDVLAQAATDALRWWKFEPYRVRGKPVAVETTMAVEFKP
jgi:TonB family protein